MTSPIVPAIEPQEILRDRLGLDLGQAGLRELMPHPVNGWMRWVQILSPTRAQYESLRPHLDESFELVKAKWRRRKTA